MSRISHADEDHDKARQVSSSGGETLAITFARFIQDLNFSALPEKVIEKAKIETIDLLGAIFGGYRTECGRTIVKYALDEGGSPQATVLGQPRKVPAALAALANGTMAFILDVDSGEYKSMAHIGASVLPALLSAAEKDDISGTHFITSLVAGYEVAVRLGRSIQPSHRMKGFWSIGTFPTIGAAAAAASALSLSQERCAHALGLAGLQAAGLGIVEGVGSMGRQFLVGKAAQNSILAALLAARGFTAPPDALEGDRGFLATMSARHDNEALRDGLGETFRILDVYNKPYPSCRFTHCALDAIFELIEEHDLSADEVVAIEVKSDRVTWDLCRSYQAKDYWGELSPIFSLPLSMAIALKHGSYTHADQVRFPELVKEPEVQALAKRVTLEVDEELDRLAGLRPVSHLEVRTNDGRTFKKHKRVARGDPEAPMSFDAVADNFRFYASQVIGEKRTEEVVKRILGLDSLRRISELTGLLTV